MLTNLIGICMAVCMAIMPYADTKTTLTNYMGDKVYVIEEVADYQGEVKSHEEYCFTYEEYKQWLETR